MAKWDERYIVTRLKSSVGDAPWTPVFTNEESSRVISLDGNVIKGAFYMETAWFWPGKWPETKTAEGTVKAHTHDFDEAIGFVGTNPDDVNDLGGEVELWVDGKKNIIDKSFIAFFPAGIEHCPLKILRVDRPIFHFTAGMGKKYQ